LTPTHVIRVDPQGRNTLPKAARAALGILNKTRNIALVIDHDKVYLQTLPDFDKCLFCGNEPDQEYRGKWICNNCLTNLPNAPSD